MKRYLDAVSPLFAALVISLAASHSMALGMLHGSDIVLIVPARPAVLKLAFDLQNMRDITLVSFRTQTLSGRGATPPASPKLLGEPRQGKAVNIADPLIHVWKGNDWQYVPFNDFCSMAFIEKAPGTVIVIGDDQTVPKPLLQGMGWPCKIERLLTMDAAALINGLDPYFQFSSREWKRLADSYGLKLEDINEPKRSFNPYNIPRSKLPLETHDFRQEKGDTPPAVLIEKSGNQTNKAPDPSTLK